jgi:hypothetical protein
MTDEESSTDTALRHSEKRHRLLAENAWDVVWTMALDGSIAYVSSAGSSTRACRRKFRAGFR